jgi:hypothetical protein
MTRVDKQKTINGKKHGHVTNATDLLRTTEATVYPVTFPYGENIPMEVLHTHSPHNAGVGATITSCSSEELP